MSFQQKFLVIVLLSTAVALIFAMRIPSVTSAHRPSPSVKGHFSVLGPLAAMAVALLLVGVVSHTLRRP